MDGCPQIAHTQNKRRGGLYLWHDFEQRGDFEQFVVTSFYIAHTQNKKLVKVSQKVGRNWSPCISSQVIMHS